MTVTLRPATHDDLPDCARILGDWCRDTIWMPSLHTRAEDLGFLGRLFSTARITVADTGHATGTGPASPDLHTGVAGFLARRDGEIPALYLDPGWRGQGIGSALLKQAMSETVQLSLWTFRANDGAIAFYTRHGFREVEATDGDNDEGLPDVRMEWSHGGA
ncbi:GNAT family N-acetyltransferase [Pelagovum pacificum]|uniref:GNAT family N-acetyltransferase n=1 Tax=Pelagovum pacificum TaxID=2588711 RepID=A0A5C5G8B4_9RHOB|nr:GNAT family N-acetyltransferase [Pelagovum pacificum]QQA41685.1 GNAT family N-acetyltransferase [Pelagovum pacificum]TNY30964.1 GNAT family N-acetyltransferase [Pelagovum pacificum]